MDSREVIRVLTRDGWYQVNQAGSHKQFKHPAKKGRGDGSAPEKGHPLRNVEEY